MPIGNVHTEILTSLAKQLDHALGGSIRAIVSEEADKASEAVRGRVNKLVAETALNVAQFYEVQYERGRIVIEIRGVPKVPATPAKDSEDEE